MAFQPPPNVLKAGQLPARIRTGAKTATKDQERDYLDRFRRLSEDPSVLVPRWEGSGPDPFRTLRRKLEAVQKKQESNFWLKWHARGKALPNAYASTLLVLRSGKIPSFASIKFRGRDVKFVFRGRGQRDKLISVQNHEEPDVRLLGYLGVARKGGVVLVSLEDDFFALAAGTAMPSQALQKVLRSEGLETRAGDAGVDCLHADGRRALLAYRIGTVDRRVRLCQPCVKRLGTDLEPVLEAYILAPKGRLNVDRAVVDSELKVHPESARADLEALLAEASAEAKQRIRDYERVPDETLFEWTEAAVQKRLQERPQGFLLLDKDLWLADFETAAHHIAADDLERRTLEVALRKSPPRLRTGEATISKVLEPVWPEQGEALLREAAGPGGAELDLGDLARLRPSEALAGLSRLLRVEERFAAFPRFRELSGPLRTAHDLFKAHKVGDNSQFQQRLGAAVRNPETKPLALALARAFGQSAGIEWQYAPHEKDQALFFEPYARALAVADAGTYENALSDLASALSAPAPIRA